MTLDAVGRYICTLAMLCVSASDAAAQATHADWLTQRTAKQARHHRLTVAATRPSTVTITTIHFYSDPAGNLVGVGEARNDSRFKLSYSRINFRFFDSNGEDLGGEWTYLFGGTNNRIVNNGAYETVLAPGEIGFFKAWTTIPHASMSSYAAVTAGEELTFARTQGSGPGVHRKVSGHDPSNTGWPTVLRSRLQRGSPRSSLPLWTSGRPDVLGPRVGGRLSGRRDRGRAIGLCCRAATGRCTMQRRAYDRHEPASFGSTHKRDTLPVG